MEALEDAVASACDVGRLPQCVQAGDGEGTGRYGGTDVRGVDARLVTNPLSSRSNAMLAGLLGGRRAAGGRR